MILRQQYQKLLKNVWIKYQMDQIMSSGLFLVELHLPELLKSLTIAKKVPQFKKELL